MDALIGILGLVLLIALPGILSYLFAGSSRARHRARPRRQSSPALDELSRGLVLRQEFDTFTADDGTEIRFIRILASGTIMVPHDNYLCQLRVTVTDVTDRDTEGPMPVICLIPDLCDADGFLNITEEITVPYKASTFKELQVAALVPDAMILPKRGQRELEVKVRIGPTSALGLCSPGRVEARVVGGEARVVLVGGSSNLQALPGAVKEGTLRLKQRQEAYGYMEAEQRDLDSYGLLARLALTVCAVDGRIDKREAAVVRRFFEQRLAGVEEREKHKRALNDALRTAHEAVGHVNQHAVCSEIVKLHSPQLAQAAYELCVQIVAADQRVAGEEAEVLRQLAQALDIPDQLARELRDRFFSASMFQDQSPEALLDMPAGLSREEQIAFLNREYQKWRSRVTHKDPTIRAEAEMRLKSITKLRRRLDEETRPSAPVPEGSGRPPRTARIVKSGGSRPQRPTRTSQQTAATPPPLAGIVCSSCGRPSTKPKAHGGVLLCPDCYQKRLNRRPH